MGAITFKTLKERVKETSRTYNYGSAANPLTGVQNTIVHYEGGNMPINVRHRRSPDGKYRSGGPWVMYKNYYERTGSPATVYRYGYWKAFEGTFTCLPPNPAGLYSTEEAILYDTDSYGAQAYNILKPTRPDFTAVTSLLELREIPGQLKQAFQAIFARVRRHRALNPGKTYSQRHLAIQFGIIPVMQDTINFVEAFQGRKARFDQLLRDEGRGVRRSGYLKGYERRTKSPDGKKHNPAKQSPMTVESNSTTVHSTPYNPNLSPSLVTQAYPTGYSAVTYLTTSSRIVVWCAGKSKYLLPPGPRDLPWRKSLIRRIMGGRVTPHQVYNLIPWSWFVDYFLDLGSFMEAVSPGVEDRIVFEYAYVMQTTERQTKMRCTQLVWVNSTKNLIGGVSTQIAQVHGSAVRGYVTKSRAVASPFGWGFTHEALTPHQIGILGALGYSKLPT